MSDVNIRPADADRDAARLVELYTREYEFMLQNVESMRHFLDPGDSGKRKRSLVAERDGRIVASGITHFEIDSTVPGAAVVRLLVEPEHRRSGIGSAILEQFAAHWDDIGATTITVRLISDEGAAFAGKNGFERRRTERISHVPLAEITDVVPPAEGFVLRSLSELDDERPLYEIDCAVVADIPADEPFALLSYADWRQHYMADPRVDRDNTLLAFDGDTAVAVAWLERVGDRVWSGLTGTHPEYRGRGLAKAVKSAALHKARAAGAVDAYTNNDATNAGMLAVNNWLGYRLHAEQFTYVATR